MNAIGLHRRHDDHWRSQVARSYRGTMAIASAVSAGSALIGLTIAFHADSTPGASIVLTAIGFYVVAAAARQVRGRSRPRLARA